MVSSLVVVVVVVVVYLSLGTSYVAMDQKYSSKIWNINLTFSYESSEQRIIRRTRRRTEMC